MKYFFDTEFDEDGKTIDLISIGIVSSDKREYYAVSNEFNPEKCNDWVKANVLPHLPQKETWKPRWKIAEEVREFCSARNQRPDFWSFCSAYDWVVMTWLFGGMSGLPSGWPWYCNDIKQLQVQLGEPDLPAQSGTAHDALEDARWHKVAYEMLKDLSDKRASEAVSAVNKLRI